MKDFTKQDSEKAIQIIRNLISGESCTWASQRLFGPGNCKEDSGRDFICFNCEARYFLLSIGYKPDPNGDQFEYGYWQCVLDELKRKRNMRVVHHKYGTGTISLPDEDVSNELQAKLRAKTVLYIKWDNEAKGFYEEDGELTRINLQK